jgi:hypothetical protein
LNHDAGTNLTGLAANRGVQIYFQNHPPGTHSGHQAKSDSKQKSSSATCRA